MNALTLKTTQSLLCLSPFYSWSPERWGHFLNWGVTESDLKSLLFPKHDAFSKGEPEGWELFGEMNTTLVEGIRTKEKLKELEPQVGVIQQGKHVRPMVIRACVAGPAPVTLGCSCYCVAGLPLAFSWATHSACWPLDRSLHSLSLSFLICKMEITTPLPT